MQYNLKQEAIKIDQNQKNVLLTQITSSILCQDKLVIVYLHDKKEIVVRFVTPVELDPEKGTVLCVQHLPKGGWRKFHIDQIQDFQRVIRRVAPLPLEKEIPESAE